MSSLTDEFVPRLDSASLPSAKGHIRPLVATDFARLRDLRQSIGGHAVSLSGASLRRFFFDSPWSESEFPSLAYEGANGRIVGCLGIASRPMIFRERSIRAVIGHHLMIDASRAGTRAGIELVRRFLRGPQDLSIAFWNDFGRRIWTSLGGSVVPLHSLSWTRPLRPAQYILGMLRHALPVSAAVTLHPACQAVDATLRVLRTPDVAPLSSSTLSDDLDAVSMLSYLSTFAGDRALKPFYTVHTLNWLLKTLGETARRGDLHKVAVRTTGGRPLGWYLYYVDPSGAAEVLQIGGRDDSLSEVLAHLFQHARQRGVVEVSGRVDARLIGALSEHHCAFHRPRNTWALVHSRDPRIGDAVHAGDAFLSKLEGAPWLEIEA